MWEMAPEEHAVLDRVQIFRWSLEEWSYYSQRVRRAPQVCTSSQVQVVPHCVCAGYHVQSRSHQGVHHVHLWPNHQNGLDQEDRQEASGPQFWYCFMGDQRWKWDGSSVDECLDSKRGSWFGPNGKWSHETIFHGWASSSRSPVCRPRLLCRWHRADKRPLLSLGRFAGAPGYLAFHETLFHLLHNWIPSALWRVHEPHVSVHFPLEQGRPGPVEESQEKSAPPARYRQSRRCGRHRTYHQTGIGSALSEENSWHSRDHRATAISCCHLLWPSRMWHPGRSFAGQWSNVGDVEIAEDAYCLYPRSWRCATLCSDWNSGWHSATNVPMCQRIYIFRVIPSAPEQVHTRLVGLCDQLQLKKHLKQ